MTYSTALYADLATLTPETLMKAQIDDTLALDLYAGPDLSSSVQYAYTLDTSLGSFSYTTLPSQTYNGQGFSLSGSGAYDPTTTTFSWTESGSLGSATLSGSGQVQWVGDPTGTINTTVTIGGKTWTLTGTVEVDGMGHSSGTLTGTTPGSDPVQVSVSDYLSSDGSWIITKLPPKGQGTIRYKNGSATGTYSAPDSGPGIFGMGVVIALAVCGRAGRR